MGVICVGRRLSTRHSAPEKGVGDVRGFLQVPHALIRSGADPILLRVYLVIASFADAGKSGECTASRETIAAAAGCSVAAVKRSIATLKAEGQIDVTERFGRPSVIQPIRPKDLESGRYPGLTDPGSGLTDPGVGSHRPTKKTEVKKTEEEDKRLKPNASVQRAISEPQWQMMIDLVLLQDLDETDPRRYLEGMVTNYDEADELIKEYWQAIEHTGREDVAYTARRDPAVYARLSPRGRAFVDREALT